MAKPGRKTEYDAGYAKKLEAFADNPVSLCVRGKLSDTKIGNMIDVSRETVRKWRLQVPGRESEYKPEFALAYKSCQLAIDTDGIKHSMIERAKGFTQKKRVRELINKGPEIPGLAKMNKAEIAAAAKAVLGLELDEDLMSKDGLLLMVRQELKSREKMKLTVIKEETTTMAGDVQAAKLVLNNIDKGEDAWDTKDKVDTNVKIDGLSKLLEQIDGSGGKLPSQST